MKKVIVLNGSPKIEKSNTLKIAKAFIEGFSKQEEYTVEYIDIYKLKINNCLGCFHCWEKTPGKCIIEDDMNELINKYINSDIIIWSFPLYYFDMPSKMKAFLDRLLPTNIPFISYNDTVGCGHPSRYDLSHQKHILISTCGFCSIENNYEGLIKHFDLIYGEGKYEKILCPEGELFRVPQLVGRCNEYLEIVKKAGLEYSINNKIKEETKKDLLELLFDEKSFIEMADASWNIDVGPHDGEKLDASFNFMKQMKAVFNKKNAEDLNIVLEIFFSDVNKTYQLQINNGECILVEGSKKDYTTRIETDFNIWKDISAGKISGEQALMEHKYKVLGDFSFMFKMNDIFGGASSVSKIEVSKDETKNKTNMTIFLLPWIVFWIISSFNIEFGIIVSLIISNLIIFIAPFRFELTVYEKINPVIFSIIFILFIIFNINTNILFSITYLIFGLIWLISGFLRIPLCAWYSQNDYKNAFSNPLFIKTNRIIALYWGVFYVASFILNYLFITKFGYIGYVKVLLIIINNSLPIVLGMFTTKFSKWYPAKIARG